MENKTITIIETDVWEKCKDNPGFVHKVKNKTVKDVFEETERFLKEQDLYDNLDYFLISHSMKNEEFPSWRWIACYAVVGSSEGHYIHVDAIPLNGDPAINMFTGKTFLGMGYALKVSNMLTKVFWDEMKAS